MRLTRLGNIDHRNGNVSVDRADDVMSAVFPDSLITYSVIENMALALVMLLRADT